MKLKDVYSLEEKLWPNLDSIFKSRDITLPTKVCLVKATVFPVVMYGCESWTVKKAERWRIDAFELWCWRRLLRVPKTARRSSQSILKEISPGISLKGMVLKKSPESSLVSKEIKPGNLKGNHPWILTGRTDAEAETPVFWSFDVKGWLIGKVLDAGKDWGQKEKRHQRMRWLDGIIAAMDMNLVKLQEMVRDREA